MTKTAAPEAGFCIIPRWLHFDPTVSWNAKLVFVYLTGRMDGTGQSFPSHKRMANELGVSLNSVRRGLDELRRLGYVSWVSRVDETGSPSSNLYTVRIDATGQRQPTGRSGATQQTPRPLRADPLPRMGDKRESTNESQTKARSRSGRASESQRQFASDIAWLLSETGTTNTPSRAHIAAMTSTEAADWIREGWAQIEQEHSHDRGTTLDRSDARANLSASGFAHADQRGWLTTPYGNTTEMETPPWE